MCLELKAKHAYSEMNDNIIKALSIHCIMIQLAFFTRKKKIKDTKAINYQIYITFNNCIFSWARLWQILVLKKREKKDLFAGYACIFFSICTDRTSLMTPGNYFLGNLQLYSGKYSPRFYFRPFCPHCWEQI